MKFLCIECDEAMKLLETRGPFEGSMTVVFGCPECNRQMAMLTNSMETQMVRSLDVKIGGASVPPEPMGTIRSTLENQDATSETAASAPEPTSAPESSGSKCPFTGTISEAYAAQESDISWSPEAEERLQRIPVFVRPMVRKSIEQQAREQGLTTVDEAMMDNVKDHMGM